MNSIRSLSFVPRIFKFLPVLAIVPLVPPINQRQILDVIAEGFLLAIPALNPIHSPANLSLQAAVNRSIKIINLN